MEVLLWVAAGVAAVLMVQWLLGRRQIAVAATAAPLPSSARKTEPLPARPQLKKRTTAAEVAATATATPEDAAFVFFAKKQMIRAERGKTPTPAGEWDVASLRRAFAELSPEERRVYEEMAREEQRLWQRLLGEGEGGEHPAAGEPSHPRLETEDKSGKRRGASRPWMGGGVPIAPLLEQHAADIAALRTELGQEGTWDDVVLLRYLLSKITVQKAAAALRFAGAWRREPRNKFCLDLVAAGEMPGMYKVLVKHGLSFSCLHAGHDASNGGPVAYARFGAFEAAPLFDIFSVEEVEQLLSCAKEQAFLQCDRETRASGELVKMLIVNDLEGVRLLARPPKPFLVAFGNSTKIAENLYPQVLGANILINSPTLVSVMISVARLFLSQRLMNKFRFCKRSEGQPISECPFIAKEKAIAEEDVPSFLGGQCQCPGGCVAGMPNDAKPHSRVLSEEELGSVRAAMEGVRAVEEVAFQRYAEGSPIEECFQIIEGADVRFLPFAGGRKATASASQSHSLASLRHRSEMTLLHNKFGHFESREKLTEPPADPELMGGAASTVEAMSKHKLV